MDGSAEEEPGPPGARLCICELRKVSGLSSGSIFISSQFSVAQAGSGNSVSLSGHSLMHAMQAPLKFR